MVGKFFRNVNGKKKLNTQNMSSPLYQTLCLRVSLYTRRIHGSRVHAWDNSLKLEDNSCGHIISSPSCDLYDKTTINELELWPIIPGLQVWYPELKEKSVSIFTDNTKVYHMVRKGTSSNTTCMQWLRETSGYVKLIKLD